MKTILALLLLLATLPAKARLGETFSQCVTRYGEELLSPGPGEPCGFLVGDIMVMVYFDDHGLADYLIFSRYRDPGITQEITDVQKEHLARINLGEDMTASHTTLTKRWKSKDGQLLAGDEPASGAFVITTHKGLLRRKAATTDADREALKGF